MSYFNTSQDSIDAATAQGETAYREAVASTEAAQTASAAFMLANGAQVLPGHPSVTGPAGDGGGDADLSGPDASDG